MDIVQIPTANLCFRPRRDRTKCSQAISEPITDWIEINSHGKSGVYDHGELEKGLRKWLQQRPTTAEIGIW